AAAEAVHDARRDVDRAEEDGERAREDLAVALLRVVEEIRHALDAGRALGVERVLEVVREVIRERLRLRARRATLDAGRAEDVRRVALQVRHVELVARELLADGGDGLRGEPRRV